MKLSTLILLAALAAIGYGFVHEGIVRLPRISFTPPADVAVPSPIRSAEPISAPKPRRTSWTEQDIAVARGVVAGRLDEGLIMQCTDANIEMAMNAPNLSDASTRTTTNVIHALQQQEERDYGPLLTVKNGQTRTEPGVPTRFVTGMVLVRDFPPGNLVPGKRLRVVVAPLGAEKVNGQWMETFTAVFTTSVAVDTDWRFHSRHALDPR